MAIEYALDLDSRMRKSQAFELMADFLGATFDSDEDCVYMADLYVYGIDVTPGLSTIIHEEAFHFTPSLKFWFRLQQDVDVENFYRLMLRASMMMLEYADDAVLLFDTVIVFQRLGGRLVFNTDYQLIVGETDRLLREEVHVPYERRSIPRLP